MVHMVVGFLRKVFIGKRADHQPYWVEHTIAALQEVIVETMTEEIRRQDDRISKRLERQATGQLDGHEPTLRPLTGRPLRR